MLRIGVTGGVAAGKSSVASEFARLGAVVIDADALAREVVEPGTPGFDAVVAEFGHDIVGPEGRLDREALAGCVFFDEKRRKALNAIIHPLVRQRREDLVRALPDDAIVIDDVPLLVENNLASQFCLVIVVEATVAERMKHLVDERGMSPEEARARMAAQATDEERRRVADIVIDNTGSYSETVEQVKKIWHERILPLRNE